jgi:hypothetical protein
MMTEDTWTRDSAAEPGLMDATGAVIVEFSARCSHYKSDSDEVQHPKPTE